ncbi:MAG: IS200/IS605 family element transposase accessory protein TnpB [Pleurocapsa sp. SU_196_0]|nr:IS200/IS605 family element transposase accessory protein TnpB [Pleurocapsa sp. SU_196_0]
MPTHRKVYRFRMRPTKAQQERLYQLAGARRFAWNWGLATRKAHFETHGEGIGAGELSKRLTALKQLPETAWLKDADSQLLQQSLKDLDTAYKNFFEKRTRFPRFKSRKADEPRFRIPQRVKVEGGRVYVPKIGWVRIYQSQSVDWLTKSATFKRDACGHWYVTLTAEFEMPDTPLKTVIPDRVIGFDAGLKDFAMFSDGERVATPKFYRRGQKKLRRTQRQLSRRKKGSKNRDRSKKRVARVHRKIANQRKDFLHKLSTRVVVAHDGVCVEDLNLKGMAKTKLAKSVLDASHGEFRRQLEYKCAWNRKHFQTVSRWFPSSRLCRHCGSINANLQLSDRVWTCACGVEHDRDLNAAQNIRVEGLNLMEAAGQTDSLNACGASVSHHFGAVRVEARIPLL